MPAVEFTRNLDQFWITDDINKYDLTSIHSEIASTYWAKNIPFSIFKRSIENSTCIGLFDKSANNKQIGFARFITDKATFAYLGDVYILPAYQKKGLAKWMLSNALEHPDLQGLRRISLVTKDAFGLYEKLGFDKADNASGYMHQYFDNRYSND
ncbi:GNAT family N-acetyltransferase [Catenovulum sp. SM1970]|uniref:GNAT family N-acetyltransferase n=1 Tax=Marinifaba aquimaris TaxID=2741323 RepID=UPI00157454CB|nr:GNAT family N-acetyltransferase [Marinifaba aquimaris]NTS75603.1 GNAT family N-acetyltransferase [Marinifaba aquimaris]